MTPKIASRPLAAQGQFNGTVLTPHPEALWLNPSLALKPVHRPLIHYLQQFRSLAEWDYHQTPDEPSSLEIALALLHDHLKPCDHSVHLIGHSTGGLLAWQYAQRYPNQVRSLTLLAVGAFPQVDWQAHYYMLRQLLPCPRQKVLAHMTQLLFGDQCRKKDGTLLRLLDRDLTGSLSPHSVFHGVSLFKVNSAPVPLLVCGGEEDRVVDPTHLNQWQPYLNAADQLWLCPRGRHFFHTTAPGQVGDQVLKFWARHEIVGGPE